MRLFKLLLYLVPIRFGRRRHYDPQRIGNRVLSNRWDPESGVVLLGDLVENAKDEWHVFSRRAPRSSLVLRDENNRIQGSASRRR